MVSSELQLAATVVLGFGSRFLAAFVATRLAVRNLRVQLGHQRLDELRAVLDEAATELAAADKAYAQAFVKGLGVASGDAWEALKELEPHVHDLITLEARLGSASRTTTRWSSRLYWPVTGPIWVALMYPTRALVASMGAHGRSADR
jgi:hypothetical protein